MNTSRKMNTSRSKRKKAIPHYFRKNQSSLSDILQAASYKRRIKELLKNNKSLALTVQDAKYTIANQLKEIEGYARTSNRVSYAQLKLKDMASSIQKLVCDLQQVQEYLDVDGRKTNFDSMDRRIRIQAPDYSTIEESASRTTLEVDMTLADDRSPSRTREVPADAADSLNKSHTPRAVESVKSDGFKDDDMTEIYDHNATVMKVGPKAKGVFVKPLEDNNRKNQIKDNSVSIPIQSHPKPPLETSKNKLPGRLEAFLQNYKESPRKPLQALNSGSLVKNTSTSFISKIPKVSKTLSTQKETEIPKPDEAPTDIANRRETFVVMKPCSIPEVFATAEDRRGTFVISNSFEVSEFQNDRRETYIVPPKSVAPSQEKIIVDKKCFDPVPSNNFAEPFHPAENEIPNRTILLCEDMELTEVIPTRKEWTEAVGMAQPCEEEIKHVLPKTSKDVEFTGVISKLPIVNSPLHDAIIAKEHAVLEKNIPSKQSTTSTKSLLENDCVVKHCTSKSNNPPLPVLSDTVLPERNESEDAKKSRKSAVKRKKSYDLDPPEKPKKGRASSTSRRKSVAPQAASDVNSKGAHRKGIARTSLRKSAIPTDPEVDFCTDLEGEIFSDISISSSPSPHKRKTRDKKSINFEKYFIDASCESVPEPEKDIPFGRRVIDFFETRQSLLPNKRNFVFTTKTINTESTSTAQESDNNSKAIESTKQEVDTRVFEFTACDSEDANRKSKKSKKRSKKADLTSQSPKRSKKPHLEDVSHQQTEKVPEIVAEHKNKPVSKKSESVSTDFKKKSFPSTSSETADDSFVIGDKMDEIHKMDDIHKMQELVNSKGERIVLESSKPSHKTQRKKLSTGDLNKARPSEDSQKADSNVCQYVLVHSPPIVQDNGKSLSPPDIDLPGTSSEESSKNSYGSKSSRSSNVTEGRSRSSKISEGFSSRSSKESGGRGRVKRTFSGVSDRRSKKKSTLDPSDFLDEFNSPITLDEAPSKAMQLDSIPLLLDCEMTEVYNLKDIIQAKAQEEKPKYQEQVSVEKHAQQQLKAQEDKLQEKNQGLDSKLNQNQAKAQEGKSKCQEQLPSKKSTHQKTVQDERLKSPELSGEELIQQKAYAQKDKTRKNKEISGDKLIEQNAMVQEDKSRNMEKVPGPKTVQQKAKVKEDKLKNKEVSGEKLIQQKVEVQERVCEDELKNKENKATIPKADTLAVQTSKNASAEMGKTFSTCSKGKEATKECNKEQESSDKESKSLKPLIKLIVTTEETLPSSADNSKQALTNHEQVSDLKKQSHLEPSVSKVVKNVLPKTGVLGSTGAVAPPLQKEKHKSSKELNSNMVTTVLEKQKEESAKYLKVTQNVKSKNKANNEEPSVPCSSTDKNNSVLQNTAAKFNRADFNAMHLDDLTSTDFVAVKTKKLFKESQNKMDGAPLKEKQPKSKPRKPRTEKPNSKENKTAKVKDSIEADLNLRASKDGQNFDEVFNEATSTDAVPIHRQNCSGSIGSLCNADSKENEGRPSRRNRITKSYKEPSLNVKMRR